METSERRAIYEDRELILDFLNSVYPLGLPERELIDALLDLPRPIEGHRARRDLAYLEARGLIAQRREQHPITKAPLIRWTLSARGMTFCENGKPWAQIEDLKD